MMMVKNSNDCFTLNSSAQHQDASFNFTNVILVLDAMIKVSTIILLIGCLLQHT